MDYLYIIAGNVNEYQNWLFHQKTTNCRYVGGPDILRGIENPHGVFIGTWYERKDIQEILVRLLTASRVENPALRKAIKYYEDKQNERTN